MSLEELNKMLRRTLSVDLNYNCHYTVKNLFPISIHQFEIKNFNNIKGELIDYAYKSKAIDLGGVNISNIGGWQSAPIDLSKDDLINNFLGSVLSNLPFIDKSYDFNMDAWVNINNKGHFNMPHLHPMSNLSGVVWLKCPQNCGNIVFMSPYEFMGHQEIELYSDGFKEQYNQYTSYYFTPTEGCIVLFPSYLMHEVRPNKSNEDRISIAFNMRFE